MIYRSIAICAVALSLAACGGGGSGTGNTVSTGSTATNIGGGDSVTPATGNDWLKFTPSAITVTNYEGEATPFRVTATSSQGITRTLQVAIQDSQKVLGPTPNVTALSKVDFLARLTVSPTLTVGTHTGTLVVSLCDVSPLTCVNPYPGSPWQVPYSITVRANTNLTPLRALAGATAWSTFQGNAAHTGYVPATLSPADFSRRFIWKRSNAYPFDQTVSTPVIENGRACMNVVSPQSFMWSVTCVSEQTGQVLWSSTPAPSISGIVSAVALAQDKVYVTSTTPTSPTPTIAVTNGGFYYAGNAVVSGFNASNGNLLFRQKLSMNDGSPNLAPVPVGNAVYVGNGGRQQGVDGGKSFSKLDASTGALVWTVPLAAPADWTPALANGRLFALANTKLFEADPATGATKELATAPASMVGAPALDGSQAAYAVSRFPDAIPLPLTRFDLASGAATWTVRDNFRSNPVVVGDTVYVRVQQGLQARSAASGALLWQWNEVANPDVVPVYANSTPGSLVVVGKHAFVSSETTTTAIDLATRQAVWSDNVVGGLSVSANGILYISGADKLVAVNLH